MPAPIVPVIYFGGAPSAVFESFAAPFLFQTAGPTYTPFATNSSQVSSIYRKYWNPATSSWGCMEQVWDGCGGNNYFANLTPNDYNTGNSGVVLPNFVQGIHLGAGGTPGASPNDANGIGITIQRSIEAAFDLGVSGSTYPALAPQASELFVQVPGDFLDLYAVDDANVVSAGIVVPWKGGPFGEVMVGAIGPTSFGGNLFIVGVKGGTGTGPYVLAAYMSTDGGKTWTEQDAGGAITLTGGTNMSYFPSSNTATAMPNWVFLIGKPMFDATGVIYIPVRQTNGYQHTIAQFDCSNPTSGWSQSAADMGTAGGGPTPPNTVSMIFAFRMPSGDIVAIYNGHAFDAVVYAILSGGIGGTWGAITNAILSVQFIDVKQDGSGKIHVLYTKFGSPNQYCHNTIDATGTVGTETVIADGSTYNAGGSCLTVYGNVCVAAFQRIDGSSIDAFFSDSLNPSSWAMTTVATYLEIGYPSYQGSPSGGFALAEMGLGSDPCASSGSGPTNSAY